MEKYSSKNDRMPPSYRPFLNPAIYHLALQINFQDQHGDDSGSTLHNTSIPGHHYELKDQALYVAIQELESEDKAHLHSARNYNVPQNTSVAPRHDPLLDPALYNTIQQAGFQHKDDSSAVGNHYTLQNTGMTAYHNPFLDPVLSTIQEAGMADKEQLGNVKDCNMSQSYAVGQENLAVDEYNFPISTSICSILKTHPSLMEDSAAMHNQATFLQTRTPSNPSP
jgi:hypothetical protein